MTDEEFWAVVDQAVQAGGNDPEEREAALGEALNAMTPEAILAFATQFERRQAESYRWELWAAAYVIHGGCSDDSFADFRDSLICSGRAAYEAALADPDSLAAFDAEVAEELLFHEGFGYLAMGAYEEKTGEALPDSGVAHPEAPSGREWREDSREDLASICPRLVEKYGA